MKWCREIGHWIEENVVTPVERFFERAEEVCEEVGRWVEQEVLTPVERWREQQEQRCREEKCVWACLCCNKLFCWFVTVLVSFIEWVIKIVLVWLVETICKIVITVIRFIVMIIIQVLKWVVLFVICLLEGFCAIMILIGALALLAMLIAIAVQPIPVLAPTALPLIAPAAAIAITALLLARFLCERSSCRVYGAVGWALKWAIVVGVILAITWVSPLTALIAAIYGGLTAALIILIEPIPCTLPDLRSLP